MVSKLPIEFRKYIRNCYELRRVLTKTEQSLDEISYANLFPEENLKDTFLNNGFIEVLRKVLNSEPALLITGQDCNSKAALINILLGQTVLPPNGSNWRWIRLTHGRTKRLRLTFDFEYEIVEPLYGNEQGWSCVPEVDIRRTDPNEDGSSPADSISTTLEVEMPHPALRDGVQIYVCPDCPSNSLVDLLTKSLERITPITFYAIGSGSFHEENVTELRKLKETYPDSPILFVDTSDYHFLEPESTGTKWSSLEPSLVCSDHGSNGLRFQLESLGLINNLSDSMCRDKSDWKDSCFGQYTIGCLSNSCEITEKVASFVRTCLQFRLVRASAILSEVHNNCLRKFILSAFDMAREIQITPRKIQYARQREAELYESLMSIACKKQEEISRLIQVTLQDMKANISDIILEYRCESRTENTSRSCSRNVEMATAEIQQLVLRKLSTSVATELVRSVSCLQEYFIGTLQRCLESLERNYDDREENLLASDAVKQILNAAYNVDLKSSTSFSLVHTFLERLRKLIHGLQLPWTSSAQLRSDANWRLQVATDMIDSLSSFRLARTISTQFQEKIRTSHECFENAMRSLESHYSGLLEQTEEQRVAIRKRYAPRLARLALDSTSMCDMVRWGVPACGKEIGRGQYGVVFACTEPWAGVDPCAVKSVVPPDERHWNDLAMEFYYTRSIPEHPRIVKLRGSIVDHSYGAGCSPAVLLVMERMTRDLYCGLKTGLVWQTRLQIAIDVVEGIRYLHSQGLVHRDIKLKNVLLDCEDRAKLTDLGFCIPEAMMSGSIVGTPIHMAPELLSGHYDSSVDVYAFGILFWYICAGQVRLPYVFEQFQNKEQLWNNVRKGIRPERLPHFDYSCWNLMERCWSGEPCQRPYLGDVQPQLESIMKAITTEPD